MITIHASAAFLTGIDNLKQHGVSAQFLGTFDEKFLSFQLIFSGSEKR